MKTKFLLCVAVLAVATCLISCADIFGGSGQDSITVTIPAFSTSSDNSRAANTDSMFSKWNVHAFLVGTDIDSEGLKQWYKNIYEEPFSDPVSNFSGILQTVSYKGVDFSRDVPVSFKRVKPGTEYFVVLFITYDMYDNEEREEQAVFYGISPSDVIEKDNTGTAVTYFLKNLDIAQSGVNNVDLMLKKNEQSNVYFFSKNGTTAVNETGETEQITPEASTPKKPAKVDNSDNNNGLSEKLKKTGSHVIILTEDIVLDQDLEVGSSNLTSATMMSLPGTTVTLTLESNSRKCNVKINKMATFSLVDGIVNADVSVSGDTGHGTLAIGGNAKVEGTISLKQDNDTHGVISVISPLEQQNGNIVVEVSDVSKVKEKQQCILIDDTGTDSDWSTYFDFKNSDGSNLTLTKKTVNGQTGWSIATDD
ncbi:MAG: hypothetical protein J6I73_02960 [Treponema sp.]|nr:hypothetical protein [Treponema sp.]